MLIVVQGASATGKTTLPRKLAKDLNFGLLAKDDIKELLLDKLGNPENADRSAVYSRATMRAFFGIVDEWLNADSNRHLILESAFITEFANEDFRLIRDKYDVSIVQIYVSVDSDERRLRLKKRNENGSRHPGHLELERSDVYDDEFAKKYSPLAIERTIDIDTSHFDDKNYIELLEEIKKEVV
ncbi:MAG: hypothetical protein JWN75_533 [Candidatus Saccharibacteria bacterium]|nr:hypothetical protein [Candidatus Saccharibacteria bacterium]